MKPLETERLVIRNWQDRDRDLLYEINSDETVMKFFPFRRTRDETDAFLERLRASIDKDGFGFCALEIKETGETIGFAGIKASKLVPTLPHGTVEIGWRLAVPSGARATRRRLPANGCASASRPLNSTVSYRLPFGTTTARRP